MKTILIILCLLLSFSSYSQTRQERKTQRNPERAARKDANHAYKFGDLPGAKYPKAVRPRVVRWLLVSAFIGVGLGQALYESNLIDKKK